MWRRRRVHKEAPGFRHGPRGVRLTFRTNTPIDARRRGRIYNIGRELVLNTPPATPGYLSPRMRINGPVIGMTWGLIAAVVVDSTACHEGR